MASTAYEGGIGGKFRKRPFRRAAGTPYDRPPEAAIRGLRNRNAWWLSKLVDPASRVIATTASKLFSSVFQKRLLTAAPPDEHLRSGQDVPVAVCINPSSEVQEQGGDGDNPVNNSDFDGISELEQLLKQKTFTRVQFDCLTELLRSRTMEPSTSQPAVNHERKEKPNVSAPENETGGSRLYENISASAASLSVPEEEAASPADLAKAYMGYRTSKVSASALNLQGQVFQEDTTLLSNAPYAIKSSDLITTPRYVVHFSGVPGLPENDYMTPRPRGRSAIYKMSRSPYFNAHPTTNTKGGGPTEYGYASPSTSHWTPTHVMLSGGRQVLKRGSSVFDSEGSFGPIRRIRQKHILSPSKGMPLTSSIQKPLLLDEQNYGTAELQEAENGYNRISYAGFAPIPPQSSEMARKILQQLDKLVPSPKEKPSEINAIAKDESPSKLMPNMLYGLALRSMDDIVSSKCVDVQSSGNYDTPSDSHPPSRRNFVSQKQDRVEKNDPSKPTVSGVKLTFEADSRDKAVISAKDAKPSMKTADFVISGSAAVPQWKKAAFQMGAPEGTLELDDYSCSIRGASSPSTTGKDKLESTKSERRTVSSLTEVSEKSLVSSSQSIPTSSPIFNRVADVKAPDRPIVAEKDVSFTFSAAAAPSALYQPLPTPTTSNPLLGRSATHNEETAAPVFTFASKDAHTLTFSSTMAGASDPTCMKIGASNVIPTTALGESNLDGGKTQKARDLHKSFGSAVSSGLSTSAPAVFAFGASNSPRLSNGSLTLSSSTLSVSAAPVVTGSGTSVSSIFSTSSATYTSTSNLSISPASPRVSTVPSFQFGSGTSAGAPISVSPTLEKSGSLEPKSLKAPPFSITSSLAPGTSFATTDTGSCSSALVSSSTLLSTCSSLSALARSSAFSSTGNNVFGFSASVLSSTSSLSYPNKSSQNRTNTYGATAGSVFGTHATQSGNAVSQTSQSTASQFVSFASFPTLALSSSSSFGFGSSPFESANPSTKSFSSSSGFGLSSSVSLSADAGSSSSGSNSSFAQAAATSLFGSSSQSSSSSIFGSSFNSLSSPSTGFSFGLSAPTSGSSPLTFDSSSAEVFSFTSAGTSSSSGSLSVARPVFGTSTPAFGFSSGSPGNYHMNVEDIMTDDTVQASIPMISTFGQPANSPALSNLMFGSPAVPSVGPSVFQFGSHQNSTVAQSPSPFQATGSLELPPGGSFSLGSGGVDKSGRKFVKVRRDKLRKK